MAKKEEYKQRNIDFLKEISNKLAETFDEMGLFSDEIETIFKFLKVEFEFKEEKY